MMTDDLQTQTDQLNFGVEKSIRYHQRRRGFYDWVYRISMFAVILCGSASFGSLFGYPQIFAAAATIFAGINLVWTPAQRARNHEMLFRQFSDLAINIRTTPISKDAYNSWVKDRIEIEMNEPPIFTALEADCDNEVRRAWGRTQELVKIGMWPRLTMNLLRHANTHYQIESVT